MKPNYYATRAQAAYAAAEAADDPRDAAAWKAAGRTWEQLSKPVTDATYSMAPHRLQLAALKRGAAEPLEASSAREALIMLAKHTTPGTQRVIVNTPVTIEF